MIELVIIVFRNLLMIPKTNSSEDSSFFLLLLQQFKTEGVLDSVIFMTQSMESEFSKKISFHYLEILFSIFQEFSPCDFFEFTKKQTLRDYMERENKMKKQRINKMSSRHSKFGTSIIIKDKSTNMNRIVHTLPNKISKTPEIGRKTAPKRKAKPQENPECMHIHKKKFGLNNFRGTDEEEQLKAALKEFAIDFIENSFNKLIEVLLNSFYSSEEKADEEHEKYKFIKISSFFMAMCRLKAHEELKEEKEKLKKMPPSQRGPEPKINVQVGQVSNSLKLQNIDYVFSKGFFQMLTQRKTERKMDMFLASVEYLLELMYIIKDMEAMESEKMNKNAQVLKQKLFTLQICELAKFGIETYDSNSHSKYFIQTMFRFTHTLLGMLEVYSKGKILYIKTHKLKHHNKDADKYDDDEDALEYGSSPESQYIEKQFNFSTALMDFSDFGTISCVMELLKYPEELDDELIEALATF